jgi:transposase
MISVRFKAPCWPSVPRAKRRRRASRAEAMVTHLKLLIAKMKRERFGQSAERGRKLLDQLEL